MAIVDQRRQHAGVILRAPAQVVLRGQRPTLAGRHVRGKAGAHQLLVRRLQPGEEAVDAIEEARLVDPAGGRQDRPRRPLDPVGQRALGELRSTQPPLRLRLLADPDQARVVVTPQLLANEAGDHLRPAGLDAVGSLRCLRAAAGHQALQDPGGGELGDDGGNDPGQARRLTSVSEERRDGTLDGRREVRVGQVARLGAEPERTRFDGMTEPILRGTASEMERDRIARAA